MHGQKSMLKSEHIYIYIYHVLTLLENVAVLSQILSLCQIHHAVICQVCTHAYVHMCVYMYVPNSESLLNIPCSHVIIGVCMYVCLYECVHVCVYVCIYVRMHVCMYDLYVRIYVRACAYTQV